MTRQPQGPCQNCHDRSAECHSKCERYAKFREELEAWKRGVNHERYKDLITRGEWSHSQRREWLQNHKNRRHMH